MQPGAARWAYRSVPRKVSTPMALWLVLILVGIVMIIIGVATAAAKFLIWLGIAILVISLVMSLLRRGKARV